jgi:hypothetical protein
MPFGASRLAWLRVRTKPRRSSHQARPAVETLESRLTPYVLSGYKWASPSLVTASFVPDGTPTDASGVTSNLFSTLNAQFGSASTWQYQYAKALQTWAYYAPLNFRFVSDNGSAWNCTGPAQGSTSFGDTRFFGYTNPHGFNGGYSYWPWTAYPSGATTGGGDSNLATNAAWKIGTMPDLYSLLLHETGLTVGLGETSGPGAVMYPGITSVYTGLTSDDIAGIQALYGARPSSTAYSKTLATAYGLSLDSSGAVTLNTSLESQTDADFFAVTVPAGGDGTLTISLDAGGYSLLIPQLAVYDAAGAVVGQATAATYGRTLSLSFSGLSAGQIYKIGVTPAAGVGYFSVGAYSLKVQFGGVSGTGTTTTSTPPAPDKYEPDDTAAAAASLGSLGSTNVTGLTISSAADCDYFAFTAGASGTYKFSDSFSQVGGTGGSLSLKVLDSSLASLGTTTSTSGSGSLSVSLSAGQTYYIEAWSQTGSWFNYSFSVTAPSTRTKGTGGAGGGGKGKGGWVLLPNAPLSPDVATTSISSRVSAEIVTGLTSLDRSEQQSAMNTEAGGKFLAATSLAPSVAAPIHDQHTETPLFAASDHNAAQDDNFWLSLAPAQL